MTSKPSGRRQGMMRTITCDHGSYSGMKCPACPVVVQGGYDDGQAVLTLRDALNRHWIVCHPDHPMPR